MKRLGLAALLMVGVLFGVSGIAAAASKEVDLKIERVALFKNGLGYLTSSATLPEKATRIEFGGLPVPSLGTFWVGYPEKVKVRGLFTRMEEVEQERNASSLADILSANIGRTAKVYGAGEPVEGTILSVSENAPDEQPSPYTMNISRQPWPNRPNASVLLLKTEAGIITINARSVSRVDILGEDAKSAVTRIVKQPCMRMELEQAAGGRPVSVSYLARGITWSPSYLIDLSNPKTAHISAKAVVINEVADLDGVQLELVTGFPNVQFAEINSPMAMREALADYLNALERGRSGDRRRGRGVITQQIASNVAMWREDFSAMGPSYSTAAAGAVAEDLFFYPVGDFTIRRGETACIPLFTAQVPYKHIYVWQIPDFIDERERYRNERDEPESREEVWHSCRMTNKMEMPWTTAPAEFAKDGRFVGQDICYYTAPGAETTVRINRAMNVLADQAEFELERTRNAAQFYGYSYDLVKVKGELKLCDRLDKKVEVEVTKDLSGEVHETSPQAKDIPTAKGLKRVNPRHKLVWNIELEPGEKKTLTYVYEVYVRR